MLCSELTTEVGRRGKAPVCGAKKAQKPVKMCSRTLLGARGGWVVGINRPFSSFLLEKARRYFRSGVLGVDGVARDMGTGGAEVTKV